MIAGVTCVASAPATLDEQLVATTGCSAAEIGTILAAGADRAAHALRPFADGDAPEHLELARAIAADPGAIEQIRALYTEHVPAVPATEEEG